MRETIDDFVAQKKLAVVGVSRRGRGFGAAALKELRGRGYEVYGVNASAQTGQDLLNDPHLQSRQFAIELEHPVAGRLTYPGLPFRMLGTPGKPARLAPELGQHNDYVFGQLLGLTPEEIENLQREQVLI